MSRSDVTDRLAAVLDQAARDYDPEVPPFDPHRPPSVVLPEEAAAGRPGHRVWSVAAAAVLAVVAVATALVVLRDEGDDPGTGVATGGEDEAPGPPGAEVPAWLPDGLAPWSVTWWRGPRVEPGDELIQLLGDPGAGPVMLFTYRPSGAEGNLPGEPVTVRGRPAALWAPAGEDVAVVEWTERDAKVRVEWREMPRAEAFGVLDALRLPPSGLRADGFEPPATGPLSEALTAHKEEGELQTRVVAVYGEPGRGGRWVTVETTSAATEPHWSQLQDRFMYGADADGVVRTGIEDQPGTYLVSRPDGGTTTIVVEGGAIDAAAVARIADSVRPVTGAELVRLRDDALAWAVDTPPAAVADLPAGRVEIRGDGDHLLLCLVPAGGERRCRAPDRWIDAERQLFDGFVVDERWLVVAATRLPTHPAWMTDLEAHDVEPQAATGGGWAMSLVPVPDELDQIEVSLDDEGTMSLTRPGTETPIVLGPQDPA